MSNGFNGVYLGQANSLVIKPCVSAHFEMGGTAVGRIEKMIRHSKSIQKWGHLTSREGLSYAGLPVATGRGWEWKPRGSAPPPGEAFQKPIVGGLIQFCCQS